MNTYSTCVTEKESSVRPPCAGTYGLHVRVGAHASSAQSNKWFDGLSAVGYDSHAAAASALLGKGPTALTVQAAVRPSPSLT